MDKPKLNFAHLCDTAFLSQEGKANIVGIFKIIFADDFPFHFQRFSVVTGIGFNDKIGKHKEELEIIRKDDNKRVGPDIGLEFEVDEKEQDINFIADVTNVTFDKEGDYFLKILVDKEEVGSIEFSVVKK